MKIHIEVDTATDDTSDIHDTFVGLANAFATRSPAEDAGASDPLNEETFEVGVRVCVVSSDEGIDGKTGTVCEHGKGAEIDGCYVLLDKAMMKREYFLYSELRLLSSLRAC